ncbi:hypothetical protein A2U01_0103811, partial [Trifolium medium]|nr:hypothetical protein [Trifolium medium]
FSRRRAVPPCLRDAREEQMNVRDAPVEAARRATDEPS